MDLNTPSAVRPRHGSENLQQRTQYQPSAPCPPPLSRACVTRAHACTTLVGRARSNSVNSEKRRNSFSVFQVPRLFNIHFSAGRNFLFQVSHHGHGTRLVQPQVGSFRMRKRFGGENFPGPALLFGFSGGGICSSHSQRRCAPWCADSRSLPLCLHGRNLLLALAATMCALLCRRAESAFVSSDRTLRSRGTWHTTICRKRPTFSQRDQGRCARGLTRRGAAARQSPAVGDGNEREIVRFFVLRNSTAAAGVLEFSPLPPSLNASTNASGREWSEGRARTFQTLCKAGEPSAPCTIVEIPYKEGGLGSKVKICRQKLRRACEPVLAWYGSYIHIEKVWESHTYIHTYIHIGQVWE